MRILHVIPSISAHQGGPSTALRHMAEGVAALRHEVHVATTDDDGYGRFAIVHGQIEERNGVSYWFFPRLSRFYITSWDLAWWLMRNSHHYDVIHIHSLFTFSTSVAARAARRADRPYIIRPYGTLRRWGIANRRPQAKQFSLRWIERPLLARAACLHFTSEQEQAEARALGITTPSVVLPLGLPIESLRPTSSHRARFFARHPDLVGRPLILFMSRFHPVKALELLLSAFARAWQQHPESRLLLAGGGDPAYHDSLKTLVGHLGIEDGVRWLGFVEGDAKVEALGAATFFAMPSYSENFGIAAVEALAAGLPTIVSDQVPLHTQIVEAGAGWAVPCTVDGITQVLLDLLENPDTVASMSANAAMLARSFSVEAMAKELGSLYARLVSERAATFDETSRESSPYAPKEFL